MLSNPIIGLLVKMRYQIHSVEFTLLALSSSITKRVAVGMQAMGSITGLQVQRKIGRSPYSGKQLSLLQYADF